MEDDTDEDITKLVPKKHAGGRKPLLVENEETLKIIRGLAVVQCTQIEVASVLRVSEATFEQFLRQHPKAREAWDQGKYEGKSSLRRLQWKAAQKGNSAMLVWLGKQMLGQKDKTFVAGDRSEPPVGVEHSLEHGLNVLLLEARREKEKIDDEEEK